MTEDGKILQSITLNKCDYENLEMGSLLNDAERILQSDCLLLILHFEMTWSIQV